MVRSQTCQGGLVQLQDCIGELDSQVFSERYINPVNYLIYTSYIYKSYNVFVTKNQNNIFYILRYLPLLKTTKLKRMPMFEAVFASGVAFKEDLENQAMKLVSEIGPHVQDQESLKLICLLQLMTPPKTWMEQVVIILMRIIN